MAGLTCKPLLHPRPHANGTHQVRLRLTKDRQTAFLDAGFALLPRHWNEKGSLEKANWVRVTEFDAPALNAALDAQVRDARATALAHPALTALAVRDALLGRRAPADEPPAPPDFVAFAQQYVAARARTDNPGTVRFYYYAVRDLVAWRAGRPWPYAELTDEAVLDFHAWLMAKPTVCAFTARERVMNLGTIAKQAVKRGALPAAGNPFPDLGLPVPPAKNPVRCPSAADVLAVLALDLPAAQRAKGLGVRRDVWELQLLTRGTRAGDVVMLRERDVQEGRLVFIEDKTDKIKSVRRTDEINAVLARYPRSGPPERYVFPLLDHRQPYAAAAPTVAQLAARGEAVRGAIHYVNDGLAILCRQAGVARFTTHAARHSFAARAWAALKDLRVLQKMFNHSSPLTTERYLRSIGVDDLDDATAAVWNNMGTTTAGDGAVLGPELP